MVLFVGKLVSINQHHDSNEILVIYILSIIIKPKLKITDQSISCSNLLEQDTRALLRLERTMNLLCH